MIAAIFIWFYTLVTAGLVGWTVWRLLAILFKDPPAVPLPFSILWLLGFTVLTSLGSFLSLVMPLNGLAQLVVLVLSGASFLTWRKEHLKGLLQALRGVERSQMWVWGLVSLAGLTILLLATLKPSNFDTGLYHAQVIHWIESYPAVPGLANFHIRLGYNSSWLLSQALYSFAFLGGPSFHFNTSVLFLVAALYFCGGFGQLLKGQRRFSAWVRVLFFPLVFYILSSEVSSPGTDAPVALITWMVLSEWLVYFESGRTAGALSALALTLISIYTVTIKLSAFPLVLPGVILLAGEIFRRRWKTPLVAAGLGLLILLPWVSRNVVLSGYMVFPFAGLDLFAVDWKVPLARVKTEVETLQAWARLPRQDVARVQSLSFGGWTREWFANFTLNRRMILLIVLAAPFGYATLGLIRKMRAPLGKFFKNFWPVALTVYLGLAFWFASAPDFRFGAGWIIAGLVLAAAPVFFFFENSKVRVLPAIVLAVMLVFQVYMLVNSIEPKTIAQRLILPADYPVSSSQPCKLGQVSLMVPEEESYGQCWYGLFPCIPSCASDFELRGTGWGAGFRYRGPTP